MNEEFKLDNPVDREIFEAHDWFDNTTEIVKDGRHETHLNKNFGNPQYFIHMLAKSISQDDALAFSWRSNRFGKRYLHNEKYAPHFRFMPAFIEQCHLLSGKSFDQYVGQVFDAINEMNLECHLFTNPTHCFSGTLCNGEVFNEFIELVRKKVTSKEFKKKINAQAYKSIRNYQSACKYFDSLTDKFADLLVLRVDLSYREDDAGARDLDVVRQDLKKFLNNRRSNQIFADVVGYMISLEYKPKKGLHFHTVIFINGAKHQKDAWIAQKIGDYWRDKVTDGRGLCFNCNRKYYLYSGIGRLHYSDQVKKESFRQHVVTYLTKENDHFRQEFGSNIRTFFKGEVGEISNTGRPRKL
ncbi:inovirus-type Gp2 protein [Undibacterium seohonense]|uniref:Inovirus-type Gp2 protein n=1 Tax=Undibacterium seohonense TaxID=1344950 RepID=A0ABR6X9N4_9BURK|nr:inovirus-type Gp2 protein [Undibacterium seohonense]MBC3809275.1 inovirus-type Gp2 protein [Undibacterium seohonense]